MFKIGEFSKLTQVSVRMLRYYDENELLIPEYVDEETGYRMYTGSQIERLNQILFLKNLGFTVKKMQEMLLNWNAEQLKVDFEQQKQEILKNMQIESEKLVRLQGYLADLERQNLNLNTQITIKEIPSYQVVSLRKVLPSYFAEGSLWQELKERLPEIKNASCFSIYHDMDYREKHVDIEACVILEPGKQWKTDGLTIRQIERIEKAACFMIYGPYDNIGIAYKEFGIWLEQHPEYRMAGANRQICHVMECDTDNPEEYITELQIPITLIS